jgi:hypothetical protein
VLAINAAVLAVAAAVTVVVLVLTLLYSACIICYARVHNGSGAHCVFTTLCTYRTVLSLRLLCICYVLYTHTGVQSPLLVLQ